MIDSHCHLDLACFTDDLDAVIHRANERGVTRFLIPGIEPSHWLRQLQILNTFPQVDIAFGYHPYFLPHALCASDIPKMIEHLAHWLERHSPLAVGEIGLDRTLSHPLAIQECIFVEQVKLAKTYSLPLVVHHRKSHDRLLGLLRQHQFDHGGVVHAFSGNADIARAYIDLGFKLGVGGTITYPRGKKTLNSLLEVGIEHLLLETDSPDMPMSGRQGQRNMPEYLPDVLTVLSEALQMSPNVIEAQTDANYSATFLEPRRTAM